MNQPARKPDANPEKRERAVPPPPAFDTHRAVKKLEDAEFEKKKAKAVVEVMRDAQIELATKADLKEMGSDIRAEMGKLDSRMGKLESHMEKQDSRMGKLDSRMGKLESHMEKQDSRMGKLESHMEKQDSRMENMGLAIRADMAEKFAQMAEKFAEMHRFHVTSLGVAVAIIVAVIAIATFLAK